MPRSGPLQRVRASLSASMAAPDLARLPRRYFRIGDVLVLDLPLPGPEAEVAEAYGRALGMRSVLGRSDGIQGEFREPAVRLLWGDPDTETHHQENGVRFRLDPARIMWSQGNLAERQRVAGWNCGGETIVDLFAGVGYFTLPLALYGAPRRIVAIEKNPASFRYLSENISLNGVADRVEAVLGDCRDVAPSGIADRVLLGWLPDAVEFVPVALRALKTSGGLLHVHRVLLAHTSSQAAFADVRRVAGGDLELPLRLESMHRVKSYGPRLEHVVLDVRVGG